MSIYVYDTDYSLDDPSEVVLYTTVNGEQIHGECAPALGATIDERNYFECALMEPLPLTDDGVYRL